MTRTLAIWAAVGALALTGCQNGRDEAATSDAVSGAETPAGADTDEAHRFTVTDFDSIDLVGAVDADVRVGDVASVTALGPDRARLVMRQTGRRILLTQRDGERVRSGRFVVTVPQLTALTLSGTGDMTVSGLNADHFDISLSGTGDLDIQGSARRARVQLSGTGDLGGDDFRVSDALELDSSGAGDAELNAVNRATVNASGAGNVQIKGAQTCTVRNSGTGNVSCG